MRKASNYRRIELHPETGIDKIEDYTSRGQPDLQDNKNEYGWRDITMFNRAHPKGNNHQRRSRPLDYLQIRAQESLAIQEEGRLHCSRQEESYEEGDSEDELIKIWEQRLAEYRPAGYRLRGDKLRRDSSSDVSEGGGVPLPGFESSHDLGIPLPKAAPPSTSTTSQYEQTGKSFTSYIDQGGDEQKNARIQSEEGTHSEILAGVEEGKIPWPLYDEGIQNFHDADTGQKT
ncbi:MAG: hypothetical protein Q9182_007295 [Xanthomendoza sp. 2 TL-2023]